MLGIFISHFYSQKWILPKVQYKDVWYYKLPDNLTPWPQYKTLLTRKPNVPFKERWTKIWNESFHSKTVKDILETTFLQLKPGSTALSFGNVHSVQSRKIPIRSLAGLYLSTLWRVTTGIQNNMLLLAVCEFL